MRRYIKQLHKYKLILLFRILYVGLEHDPIHPASKRNAMSFKGFLWPVGGCSSTTWGVLLGRRTQSWLVNRDWHIFKESGITEIGAGSCFLKHWIVYEFFFKGYYRERWGKSIRCKRIVNFHSWAMLRVPELALSQGVRHRITPHWDWLWWMHPDTPCSWRRLYC